MHRLHRGRTRPSLLVVEDLYTEYKFPRTALLMAHARGVICLAARQLEVPLLALAPAEVKRAITGNGAAGKAQVQRGGADRCSAWRARRAPRTWPTRSGSRSPAWRA